MAHAEHAQIQSIGAPCSTFIGARVQIATPGPGTIVLARTVRIGIGHTSGIDDAAVVTVSNVSTDCTVNAYAGVVWIPANSPTDGHLSTVPLLRPSEVVAPGVYTFSINGQMSSGDSIGDQFMAASLVATFYPS